MSNKFGSGSSDGDSAGYGDVHIYSNGLGAGNGWNTGAGHGCFDGYSFNFDLDDDYIF